MLAILVSAADPTFRGSKQVTMRGKDQAGFVSAADPTFRGSKLRCISWISFMFFEFQQQTRRSGGQNAASASLLPPYRRFSSRPDVQGVKTISARR
jgi:hypothetical protein